MAKPDLQQVRINPATGDMRTLKGKLGLGQSALNNLPAAADDTAAAALTPPVPIGGLYRTGSILKVRVA